MFLFCDANSILNYCSFNCNSGTNAIVYFEVAHSPDILNSKCTNCNFIQNELSGSNYYPILIKKQVVEFRGCYFKCDFNDGQDLFQFDPQTGGHANLINCHLSQGKYSDSKPDTLTCPTSF